MRTLRVRRPAASLSPAFDLAYVRTGPRTSTPVVVIPGGPGLGSIRPYRSLRRHAATGGLDIIMVEHRGVGSSRRGLDGRALPQSAMWVSDVVDDIAAVLDHEGAEQAFIAGSSYGSYLAGAFGARHPGRVAGMLLDSALQSAEDIALERQLIRSLFWDEDAPYSEAVHALRTSAAQDRQLLDVIRAAYEIGGEALLRPLLHNRLRRRGPAWQALALYSARDESIIRIPGHYDFSTVGAIGYRELGYGAALDGLPLDPARTYSRLAHRFPSFAGESFDLPAAVRTFDWPLALIVGRRDIRTPPAIAQRVANTAPDAALIMIENGHSALDTHPIAFLNAVRKLVRGEHAALAQLAQRFDELPRRGASVALSRALTAAARLEQAVLG
ncbi:alpha/beta fold hydrolase [Microbacterium sp. A196]|uniref:alpha/beta fold hydrolase n=1 Tax=Microbacterium sp. A196 TaxID=3457320 RepID=UPI003FCF8B8F